MSGVGLIRHFSKAVALAELLCMVAKPFVLSIWNMCMQTFTRCILQKILMVEYENTGIKGKTHWPQVMMIHTGQKPVTKPVISLTSGFFSWIGMDTVHYFPGQITLYAC